MREIETQPVKPRAVHPLGYARPAGRVHKPLIWQGMGSIAVGAFWLCVGAMFLVTAGVAATQRTLRLLSLGLAAAGIFFVGCAAVCCVDAIVELGGREPPRWRWYQTFGRNRRV